MRRIVAWCTWSLPFEPRSRQAIDETMADWAHEEREAQTRGRRTRAGVRGMVSILRVVSMSLLRESADISWSRGLARRFAVVAAVVTIVALSTAQPPLDGLGVRTLMLAVLGVPLALQAVLPPAIFLVFAWRPVSRAAPTAGTACFLTVVMLALAGWLTPLSSDLFNGALRQAIGPAVDSDDTLPLAFSEVLLAVTGWASLAGATALCAAMVAKQSPLRSRWWLAAVPATYSALIPLFTFTIGTSFLVFQSAGDPSVGYRPGIASWSTAALLMTVALACGRHDAPSTA